MIYALIALCGILAGAVAGWFAGRYSHVSLITRLESEKARLESDCQHLSSDMAECGKRLETTVAQYEERLAEQTDSYESRLREISEANDARFAREAAQWQERFEALKSELGRIQAEALAARQTSLTEQNSRQIADLLAPVRKQFEEFSRLARESQTASEVGRKELQNTFSSTIDLFRQQQMQAVEQMRQQTDRIGQDAASLCRALRGDNRVQGRWGEMVLEHILEESGLRKGQEFDVQVSRAGDDEGARLRPDVIVTLPSKKKVIIDSKVSLTSFASAVDVQDNSPEEAEKLLRAHAVSVRHHIDELARKDYASSEKDAVEVVLMFMPTDSSFLAALRVQPEIIEYAFERHIAIITPSNLLTTLRLIYHIWQQDRQERNVQQIVARGNELYNRMAGFIDAFNEINTHIGRLQKAYEKTSTRLTGRGGVVSQFEMLRKLGLTPKKRIAGAELAETDDADIQSDAETQALPSAEE